MIAAFILKAASALAIGRFAAAAVVFTFLERIVPHRVRQNIFRPGWLTDLLNFLCNGALYIVLYHAWRRILPNGFAWMKPLTADLQVQSPMVQALAIALVASFVYYWGHRALHTFRVLWRFHAVHHSAQQLDWLATYRGHVFETCYFTALTAVPMTLLGLTPPAMIGFVVYRFLESHIEHSNVRIPLGPLKWVLPSPWFHAWHHALDADAQNKNFSPYPLWDVLFGTAFMPAGRMPEGFGTYEPVPDKYLGQVVYPFGLATRLERLRDRMRQAVLPARLLRATSSNEPRST